MIEASTHSRCMCILETEILPRGKLYIITRYRGHNIFQNIRYDCVFYPPCFEEWDYDIELEYNL